MITAVELLPICDFDENGIAGPVNYWGYTGGYLFAPKSAYCDPYSKKPADIQCKDMESSIVNPLICSWYNIVSFQGRLSGRSPSQS